MSAALCLLLCFSSCDTLRSDIDAAKSSGRTRYWVNQFAFSAMNVYYLWVDEIAQDLKSWSFEDDPVEKVKEVRYKDFNGEDIDRWTALYDDYSSVAKSFAGTSVTDGFGVALYYADKKSDSIYAVVSRVSKGSPADKAGLKRGDIIFKVDGQELKLNNYVVLVTKLVYGTETCSCTVLGGAEGDRSITMTPVEMYEDPIVLVKTFDVDGRRVGYLVYDSFTLESCAPLVEVCRSFKAQGVSDLILDLRYNTGGYVLTEQCLASMLAPESVVRAGEVYETEVYNTIVADAWGDGVTNFTTDFTLSDKTKISTADANIGLDHIYVITGQSSASASESLLVGLSPYVPVIRIGEQTAGKYCSGILLSSDDFFDGIKEDLTTTQYKEAKANASNWGIYVMVGRYADKNGDTPCMPDGFAPDIKVMDNPLDGCQLGDPEETMLAAALKAAGAQTQPGTSSAVSARGVFADGRSAVRIPMASPRPEPGRLILSE